MRWINEENYAEQMREYAEPYVSERMEAGHFERVSGELIYFEHYKADDPKAVIAEVLLEYGSLAKLPEEEAAPEPEPPYTRFTLFLPNTLTLPLASGRIFPLTRGAGSMFSAARTTTACA